ncbi:DEAD/DEAH box helicase [Paenibacillus sp. A3M_27_13]|uniref:DEAD/DEAH box helicase n=1 Tax=Paenibacillus sp. A3M_27_13 TaxID=2962029 RepID=UPI0020B7C8FB|nr:DEAD/DEAH box helicase family protein [Paenibacillus sp. A3M_27_13]MCP3746688.1 DEAD/DEAH box helicase family protein [Paenibacillus sp. A3M_27_13]
MSVDLNYFINSKPNIVDNEELREPQILAYIDIFKHFNEDHSTRDAVAILPTGAGKTGVMGLVPFGISKGRVLVITPQLVIKDHVVESLDPSEPDNFWLKRKVFNTFTDLPVVNEFDNDINQEELENSNVIILNIHKLSARFRNSLLTKVSSDFFDMIIIDEAHHSPAETWQNALNYFKNAKVVKLTGTPFRTDRKPIEGKVVIEYRLGRAMQKKIVKSLENFRLIPDKLYLTIDDDESEKYSVEELRQRGLKDEQFIARSVALSEECNWQIIDQSIIALNQKKIGSSIPHKIIGVACSIKHAEKLQEMYDSKGLRAVVIHSDLDKKTREKIFTDIENNRYDAIIHVAMLGEGYDHKYLSVAAIFRPFKSLAPYSQFIGRILRYIEAEEVSKPGDNIGVVIAHRDLGLEPLWLEYQKELKISQVIEEVIKQEKAERDLNKKLANKEYDKNIASVEVDGLLEVEADYYITTELIEENKKYELEIAEKIKSFKAIMPESSEEDLRNFIVSQEKPKAESPLLKSPKKFRMLVRQKFNTKIHEDLPAQLITDFNVNKLGREFAKAIPAKFSFIKNNEALDNAGIVTLYLNTKLKQEFGERDIWVLSDFYKAETFLEDLVNHLYEMIKSALERDE